jgi:hypothetical protein
MKRIAVIGLAAFAMLSLAGCATTSGVASLADKTVSRHDVLLAIDGANAAEDSATATMAGCLAAHSHAGICAVSVRDSVHKALVAMRTPRDQLNAFAQKHGDSKLGVGGLYDAVVASKDSLLAILAQYGAAPA